MKKTMILLIIIFVTSSCSNMKGDAQKVCDFTTKTMEMMPEMMQLSMKAGFGDEESKKEAQNKLKDLQKDLEKLAEEVEAIKEKYDEEEFKAYLNENCEVAKKMSGFTDEFDGESSVN